jgi:hypothetical protein
LSFFLFWNLILFSVSGSLLFLYRFEHFFVVTNSAYHSFAITLHDKSVFINNYVDLIVHSVTCYRLPDIFLSKVIGDYVSLVYNHILGHKEHAISSDTISCSQHQNVSNNQVFSIYVMHFTLSTSNNLTLLRLQIQLAYDYLTVQIASCGYQTINCKEHLKLIKV